jgi:hypothetical protein
MTPETFEIFSSYDRFNALTLIGRIQMPRDI